MLSNSVSFDSVKYNVIEKTQTQCKLCPINVVF